MVKKSFLAQVKEEKKQRVQNAIRKKESLPSQEAAFAEQHQERGKRGRKQKVDGGEKAGGASTSSVYDELGPEQFSKKRSRPDNFRRAKAVYERLQEEKKADSARRKEERERREKAQEEYLSMKKKMEKALRKRTRKGQPNLGAQVEVLLEKIQKRMS